MKRNKDMYIDRWKIRWMDKQMDGQILDSYIDRLLNRWMDRQIDRYRWMDE